MRILITGATGFLGGRLAPSLAGAGHVVGAVTRRDVSFDQDSAVTQLRHDGGSEQMVELVGKFAPDVVVHAATYYTASHTTRDIDALVGSNIGFGTQLLNAMDQTGVSRLLDFGTFFQHYAGEEYNPVSLYAATKQAFQDIARYFVETGRMSTLVLKLADVYGPDDPRGKLMSLLERYAKSGEPLEMSPGEQVLSFTYVTDAVQAVHVALDRLVEAGPGTAESFSIRGDELLTLREFVALFQSVTGLQVDVRWGARPYREREVMRPWLGPLLPGWSAKTPLSEGIRQTVN